MSLQSKPRHPLTLRRSAHRVARSLAVALAGALLLGPVTLAETPALGAEAPDFTLSTPDGKTVSLATLTTRGPVVLVVLRGYPGYQCPYCTKQVHDFAEHATAFAAKNASILLVYPGPPADLDARAREFMTKQAALPANVILVTDPDYTMVNQYGLRWDAPHETAYPTTFILDRKRTVRFEKTSRTHGDRTSAEDILREIPSH